MDHPRVQKYTFLPLTRGANPQAPRRTMRADTQGPLWRELHNLAFDRDSLEARPNIAGGLSIGSPSTTVNVGEMPIFIWSGFMHPNTSQAYGLVVVTNRQAFVYDATVPGWRNVTPTYATGTITATNGSPNITGAGTAWLARKISPSQIILIDGSWYTISNVTSDTAITLSTNFSGATAGGKSYTIRRVWNGGEQLDRKSLIFCSIFNQDLYISGTYLYRANGDNSPAVIQVRDVFSTSPSPRYLTAKEDLTGTLSLALDAAGNTITDIHGMQILGDGRVVLFANNVYAIYSSHLDVTVWTAFPSGSEPITTRAGTGTGLGKLGRTLTFHFQDGIVLGEPTGLADPPLSFSDSAADSGALSARSIKVLSGREFFVNSDGNLHAFNGQSSVAIGNALPYLIRKGVHTPLSSSSQLRYATHASIDHLANAYRLWGEAMCYVYYIDHGAWATEGYDIRIGAASDRWDGSSSLNLHWIIGTCSKNPSGGGNYDMLQAAERLQNGDFNADGSAALADGASYALTDYLDFGFPGLLKTVHRVRLTYDIPDGYAAGDVRVRLDYSGGQVNAVGTPTAATQGALDFVFVDVPCSEWFQIWLGADADHTLIGCTLTQMDVWFEVFGDLEAA